MYPPGGVNAPVTTSFSATYSQIRFALAIYLPVIDWVFRKHGNGYFLAPAWQSPRPPPPRNTGMKCLFHRAVEKLWEPVRTGMSCVPEHGQLSNTWDQNMWDQIKERFSNTLSTEAYQNWIARTHLNTQQGGVLVVNVPDETTRQWIQQEYSSHIRRFVTELDLPVERVEYSLPSEAEQTEAEQSKGADSAFAAQQLPSTHSSVDRPAELMFENPASWLNPRLTFDTYVVGSCNQLAHAAATAVAKMPSRSYNPLFIYGGTGIGKTHLMHAIGRSLLDNYARMNIVYTSSERFMNEMIACLKNGRINQFHRHYRSADVLLIDDIHVLGGKERTQEEFFHTFNDLYEHQKQIVISSDSSPKGLSGLFERLRSRFEWGLIVDVQPPDLETKMAILDKKAESEGVYLPDEVRAYIANKTKSNVRELEGALTRLIAVSSLTGEPINMGMAQQALKYLGSTTEKRITLDSIVRAVAERFGLTAAQLKMKSNTRQIAYPRQVAMYVCKELTNASLPEIGRFFGGKHHTTVLHSVQKIEDLRQRDDELNRIIQSLFDSLQ
jgi:chromosomal replication initiator protein